MKLQIYQILHVLSMVLLVAFNFDALANPDPKRKRNTMIITGISAFLMLLGGFGALAVLQYGFPIWVIVKLVCWLGLAAIPALAYRRPFLVPALRIVAILLVAIAVAAVYLKFGGVATGSALE